MNKEDRSNSTFSYIADDLENFAKLHNLRLDKYWRKSPAWRFSFKHPKGGLGSIELTVEEDNLFKVYGYKWIDDYDNGSRYSTTYKSESVKLDFALTVLNEVYQVVLNWESELWLTETHGFKEGWHEMFTKEQFYKLNDKYPVPRLD